MKGGVSGRDRPTDGLDGLTFQFPKSHEENWCNAERCTSETEPLFICALILRPTRAMLASHGARWSGVCCISRTRPLVSACRVH